jgi:lysophospholipase L1-like esterase
VKVSLARILVLLTTTALAFGGSLLVAAPAAHARDQVRAIGAWSMVPQSKDANGDGVIDGDGGVPKSGALSLQPSAKRVGAGNRVAQPNERLIDGALSWYLPTRGFPVRLDACASSGAQYRWVIAGASGPVTTTDWRNLSKKTCRTTVALPEGPYSFTLEVKDGAQRARDTLAADVRNIIVVAMGDSYASGEGNPRNVRAWLRKGGAIDPYWDDDACHRSALGAPALAALQLERASRFTSVTLVDVACSGATVDAGILGAQLAAGQRESQVEQAARILGPHAADVVLLSIGGNDVGFGSILETCAFNANCPLAAPAPGPLRAYPTVQQGIQGQTAQLPGDFDRIAACLSGGACTLADGRSFGGVPTSPDASILPTLYPDITRAANGQACSYLTVSQQDFAWARATTLSPAPPATYPYRTTSGSVVDLANQAGSLNSQVAGTSRLAGWLPVVGTWSASGDSPVGHGVCAGADAWVFGFTGLTSLPSASFHPNPTGQSVMAAAITNAARSAITPRVGGAGRSADRADS